MNPIIKVYGHPRSGNNYLCALMYKNFYSGYKSTERMIERNNRPFFLFGEAIQEDRFLHPYVNIFGGHDPRKCSPETIYIVRNYEDVRKSIEKMKHKIPYILPHNLHVYEAVKRRAYIVYYEDLCESPEKVLSEIQAHFSLGRLYKTFIIDMGYCGWPK